MPSDFPRTPSQPASDGLSGQLRRAALFVIVFAFVWAFFPEAHGLGGFSALMAGTCLLTGVCELLRPRSA
jgi:hypothetical protein